MTTATTPAQIHTSQIIEDALDAFWQVVADRFPAAESGDLSPWQTIMLECAAQDAVQQWIEYNLPPGTAVTAPLRAMNLPIRADIGIRQALEAVLDHYYPDEAVHYESTDRYDPNHIFHMLHAIRRWIEGGYREC